MGRYPLTTIINGRKYRVHVVRSRSDRCAICGNDFQPQQGYVFIDEPEQSKPAHLECAIASSKGLEGYM